MVTTIKERMQIFEEAYRKQGLEHLHVYDMENMSEKEFNELIEKLDNGYIKQIVDKVMKEE